MTARATFKQADVERACRAVVNAGLQVARIEINDNGIAVIVGEPQKAAPTNPLDAIYGT